MNKHASNILRKLADYDEVPAYYFYVVDLDERGEFRAHVEDENGEEVLELYQDYSDEDSWDEDYFLNHGMSLSKDVAGLEVWLKEQGLIPSESELQLAP